MLALSLAPVRDLVLILPLDEAMDLEVVTHIGVALEEGFLLFDVAIVVSLVL